MATVSTVRYQRGRGSELMLLGLAALITVTARGLVDYHAAVIVISQMVWYTVVVVVVLLLAARAAGAVTSKTAITTA